MPHRHFLLHWLCAFLAALSLKADDAIPAVTAEGFAIPQPHAPLPLPRSHASHPDFRIEWWYLTGHLFATDSQRAFGFQATFFRVSQTPDAATDAAPFGNSMAFMSHMALTDINGQRFHSAEVLRRGGWDAYADTSALDVRIQHNRLFALDPAHSQFALNAAIDADVRFDLTFTPRKPLVRFGPDGTSRKGADPAARSFYLSFTRLATTGSLTLNGQSFAVTGSAWMDHEIASNQLGDDLAGWDWTAIQFDNNWELKAYILRDANGAPSPFSALIWIRPDGTLLYRDAAAFTWQSDRHWRSPASGARYPHAPRITTAHPIVGSPLEIQLDPVLDAQEMRFPTSNSTYYEGAARVSSSDPAFSGRAYLELTGYDGPVQGLR